MSSVKIRDTKSVVIMMKIGLAETRLILMKIAFTERTSARTMFIDSEGMPYVPEMLILLV